MQSAWHIQHLQGTRSINESTLAALRLVFGCNVLPVEQYVSWHNLIVICTFFRQFC